MGPSALSDPVLPLLEGLRSGRTVVLTGAGCSTESGIPDYRGPETRRRARHPIPIQAFLGSASARRRYWARSYVAWPRFRVARPNAAHDALAALEARGLTTGLLTQNVDGLHHAAGSRMLVELHGCLSRVRCLVCSGLEDREALQMRLDDANAGFEASPDALAPDGDVDLVDAVVDRFTPVVCRVCGGDLRPDVVFFGENVPEAVRAAAFTHFDAATALLVVGSSLEVFSGFRFVREAHRRGMSIFIVSLGPTRGDSLASIKIDARAGSILPRLVEALARRG